MKLQCLYVPRPRAATFSIHATVTFFAFAQGGDLGSVKQQTEVQNAQLSIVVTRSGSIARRRGSSIATRSGHPPFPDRAGRAPAALLSSVPGRKNGGAVVVGVALPVRPWIVGAGIFVISTIEVGE